MNTTSNTINNVQAQSTYRNREGETLREMYDRLNFEFSDYGRMMAFNDWLDWLVYTDKLSAVIAQANKENLQ